MREYESRDDRRVRLRRARRFRRRLLLAALAALVLAAGFFLLRAALRGGTEAPSAAGENGAKPWYLALVNPWSPLPEGYEPALSALPGGQSVDARIEKPLRRMLQDAEAGGFALVVVSGFRTAEKQQSILDDKIAYYEGQGLSAADARTEAARWVAAPGYSEHQLGLAADINTAGEGPTGADAYAWLAENAGRYGFILRYPEDKTELTGTAYEPWHFRYVGEEAAEEIAEQGVCLEEYLAGQK